MGHQCSAAGITVRCAINARYCSENKGKKPERNDLETDRIEFSTGCRVSEEYADRPGFVVGRHHRDRHGSA